MAGKPSFVRVWRDAVGAVALWVFAFYTGGIAVASVAVEASGGDLSITNLALGAVGGLFWGSFYFVLTGWVVVLIVSLIIAVVVYFRLRRRWRRFE